MINKQDFIDAKKNKKVFVINNFIKENPSWDGFIQSLNYKFLSNECNGNSDYNPHFIYNEDLKTDILLNYKLAPTVFYCVTRESILNNLGSINYMPQIRQFIDLINPLLINNNWALKNLMNFICEKNTTYPHKDPQDVLIWTCIGSVEYRIYDDIEVEYETPILDIKNLKYQTFLTKPGDIIFIPGGVIHQVIISEPRASIILDFSLQD